MGTFQRVLGKSHDRSLGAFIVIWFLSYFGFVDGTSGYWKIPKSNSVFWVSGKIHSSSVSTDRVYRLASGRGPSDSFVAKESVVGP
jgi:hypothetical protein